DHVVAGRGGEGDHAALRDALLRVQDQVRIELRFGPQAVTRRAGAVGAVEGEVPGRDVLETEPAVHAGEVLGERELACLDRRRDVRDAVGRGRPFIEDAEQAAG